MLSELALGDVADDAYVGVGGPLGTVLGQRLKGPVVPGVAQGHRKDAAIAAHDGEGGGKLWLLHQEPLVLGPGILDLQAIVFIDEDGVPDPVDEPLAAREACDGASLAPLAVDLSHEAV